MAMERGCQQNGSLADGWHGLPQQHLMHVLIWDSNVDPVSLNVANAQ